MAWQGELNLQSVSVAAIVEVLLILKFAPENDNSFWGPRSFAACVFVANYLFLLVYSTWIYPNFVDPLRHLPRAKRWVARKLHHQLVQQSTPSPALSAINDETPNDGLIALREPTGYSLLVTKPQVMGEMLVQRAADFQKPESIRRILGVLTGFGQFVLEGEPHRFMRKKSLPYFGFRPVKDLHPLMWNHATRLADSLKAEIIKQNADANIEEFPSGTVELTHKVDRTAVAVIGTTVFGRDMKAANDTRYDAFVELLYTLLEPTLWMQLYISVSFLFSERLAANVFWGTNRVFKATTTGSVATVKDMIQEKREAMKGNDSQHLDILSNMLRTNDLSDTQMAGQLLTYMLAGNDTTAISMAWACYLLAKDPDRQRILQKEVNEALGPFVRQGQNSGPEFTGVLEKLPYLNGVVSEAFRLFPAVPLTYRTPIRPTTLSGISIPVGTSILVCPWVMNRSPEAWGPTAEKFLPERWICDANDGSGRQAIDPTGGTASHYDFLTFLHGPRSCVGQGFARAQLRCLIAMMAMNFEWTLDMEEKDVVMQGALSIKPGKGLHLKLKMVDRGEIEK